MSTETTRRFWKVNGAKGAAGCGENARHYASLSEARAAAAAIRRAHPEAPVLILTCDNITSTDGRFWGSRTVRTVWFDSVR